MNLVPENLLFPVADMLQVNLHIVGDGLKAHQPTGGNVNGWEIKFDMKVKSDVLTKDVASFFVQVRKNLWMYVVSYGHGKKLKVMVFDSAVAKIQNGFMTTACGQGNLSTSVRTLKACNASCYEYSFKTDLWSQCPDLDDVLK